MSFALLRYTGNNSTVTYSVSFAYRSTDDVIVSLDGVAQTITTHYTFPTSGQITFVTAPGTGVIVEIKRSTSQSSRIVDYQAGSVIKETDLDNDSIQGFYMAQEAIDITEGALNKDSQDRYDATSKRIINVTDPTGDQDAATKTYVDTKFAADVASTAADVISTAADVVSTNADVVSTNADVVTTTQDAIDTAADVVLTNADVVSTNADVVSTNADVVTITGIYDDFDDRYLGAKTSAPTLDNDGNALADGSMYFNTTTPDMWVYDLTNTIWVTVSNSTASSATAADVVTTNADVVLTAADVVSTNADVVLTNADVASTNADVVTVAGYLDTFDDRYLGSKSSEPTVDNDSNTLLDGALYFNTTTNVMKVYDLGTTTWITIKPTTAEQGHITTVSGISSDVTTVAGKATEIGRLGTVDAVADMAFLGTADVVTDMNTLGTSANVTAMDTVSGSISNVNLVGGSIANVNTAATNITDINTFAVRYRIGSTDPSTSLDDGDLFYNTVDNQMKFYDGSNWVALSADTDVKTKVSANDTTAGYLNGKLTAGANISLTEGSDGGNETLAIAVTGTLGGGNYLGNNGEIGASNADIIRVHSNTLNYSGTLTLESTENGLVVGPFSIAGSTVLDVQGTLVII